MNAEPSLNSINSIFVVFCLSLLLIFMAWVSFLPELQIFIIPASFLIIYFIFLKQEHYLPFILLMYLVVVGEINPTLRVVVHILGFISLLVFLFLNKDEIKSVFYSIDNRIKKYFIYFFSIIFITTIFSHIPSKGFEIIIKELYFFFIVFSVYVYIKTKSKIYPVIFILMLSGIIMSLSSIINLAEFNLIDLLFKGSSAYRSGGLINNVNALSGYIVVVFPFFVFFYLLNKSGILRSFLILGMVILILGVFATISRSAGLSIMLGLLFVTYNINKKVTLFILLATLGVTILLLLLPTSEFILTALRLEQGFSNRDLLWQLSVDMFKDNWFLGVGPGLWGHYMFNYSPVLQDSFIGYLFHDVNVMTGGFNNSHNYYLVFMSDMGIAGLFLALYLPYAFFSIAKENLKLSKLFSYESYLLNLVLTTVGISMFIRAIFEGISIITFGWVAIDLPFWIVVTLLAYYNFQLKNQIKENCITA